MVRIGDIITGTVLSVASYGMYVDYRGHAYLIPFHELSWLRLRSASQIANVGDDVRFKVLKLHAENGDDHRLGSIRETNPDDNPWKDPAVYSVHTRFTGKIESIAEWGILVSHPVGGWGRMHVSEYRGTSFTPQVGETLEFEIVGRNIDSQTFSVRLASDETQ